MAPSVLAYATFLQHSAIATEKDGSSAVAEERHYRCFLYDHLQAAFAHLYLPANATK